MKRPILYFCASFCIGIAIAHFLQIPIMYSILTGAAFGCLSIIALRNNPVSHVSLYLAILFLGIACYANSNILPPDHIANLLAKQPKNIYLKGVIVDDPAASTISYGRRKTSFTLKASLCTPPGSDRFNPSHPGGVLDWQKASGLVRVEAYSNKAKGLSFGDEMIAEGLLSKPSGLRNPGAFDYERYLDMKNIRAVFKIKEGFLVEIVNTHPVNCVKKTAYALRHFIRNSIDKYLPEPYNGFSKAILIGDRTSLKAGLKDDFIKTGTAHVLAISGLHVGLVTVFIFGIFGLAGIPKKFNLLLTLGILVIYSFTAGASPPIIRVTIIYAVFVIGYILKRDADSLNSLSIAAVLILLWNPKELFNPGFQLSFVSVASIVILYPKLRQIRNPGSYLMKGTWVSVAAWIGTWPIVAAYFNIISPVSLIANLIIIPLLFAAMVVSFVFLFVRIASPFLAAVFAGGLCLIEQAIFFTNRILAGLPFSYFRVKAPSVGFLMLYYIFIALFFLPKPIRLGRMKAGMKEAVITLLLIINILIWKENAGSERGRLSAVFFDVGQGDAIFMKLPEGENVLIDGGRMREDAFDTGRSVIAPYLWNNGVPYINAVIVTHFHDDHLGGLLYILKNFKIGCVIENGASAVKSRAYDEYTKTLRAGRIRRIVIGEGDVMNFGLGAKFYILNPPKEKNLPDSNDNSLVLKFVYRNFSILFCGDVTDKPMERLIASYGDFLRADIIKIPHHGSLGNENAAKNFLKFVSAKTSIISGEAPNYCADYNTAEDGAITITANSDSFRIGNFSLGHRPRDVSD